MENTKVLNSITVDSIEKPNEIYTLGRAYWKYLKRKHETNLEERSPLLGLNVISGLITGGSKLASGAMGLSNNMSQPRPILDITINNCTEYPLVLYKVHNTGTAHIKNIIIPKNESGKVSLLDCKFKRDFGPELHLTIDNGMSATSFYIQLGDTTNDLTKGSGQIRIRQILSGNIKCQDLNDSANKPNTLIVPAIFTCTFSGNVYKIVSPPLSDSSGTLAINIISV